MSRDPPVDMNVDLIVPKSHSKTLNGSEITVYVGKQREPFKLSARIFRDANPIFDVNMLSATASHALVALPGIEPELFETYCHWMYFKTLCVSPVDANCTLLPSHRHLMVAPLLDLYFLGTKLHDFDLKDAVLDCLHQLHAPLDAHIDTIYENTAPSSKLRLFCVDQWVYNCRNHADAEHGSATSKEASPPDKSKEFLADLLAAHFNTDDKDADELHSDVLKLRGEDCRYHEHAPGWCYVGKSFPRRRD